MANRPGWIAFGVVAGMLVAGASFAQTAPPTQAQPAAPARTFTSDAGIVLNFVKADKTADFEAVIAKLKEALQKGVKPERKEQAAGWKVFKAVEPGPGGTVLYVFIVDPAVKGAEYNVGSLLAEALPAEVQALYNQLKDCYGQGGMSPMNLTLVQALGK
jgi:hypothetical protein